MGKLLDKQDFQNACRQIGGKYDTDVFEGDEAGRKEFTCKTRTGNISVTKRVSGGRVQGGGSITSRKVTAELDTQNEYGETTSRLKESAAGGENDWTVDAEGKTMEITTNEAESMEKSLRVTNR